MEVNQEEKSEAQKEKERILTFLFQAAQNMVSDYKNTIKHTGSVLTASMTYAYNKGVYDTIKLLAKEGNNEQSKTP
jgi:hypothetical protein